MNYELQILSPVHIGTGKKITPFEFALVGNTFVVIDMEKVLSTNSDRVDDLNRHLDKEKIRFSLSEFLTEEEKHTRSFWKYSVALSPGTRNILHEELHNAQNMDVDECIKTTTTYRPYIPGSSIKGVLRTALAYALFQSDKSLFQALKQHLTHVDWHKPDGVVNELLFRGTGNDPQYDVLRTLQISDSTPLSTAEETLSIEKMKILSLASPEKHAEPKGTMFAQLSVLNLDVSKQSPMKRGWVIQEILRPGIRACGRIHLDERLLGHPNAPKLLGWNDHQQHLSIDRLLQAANIFAQDICDWELDFFDKQVYGIHVNPVIDFYRDIKSRITQANEQTCYLCLGQGAGWHKNTIGMLLEKDRYFDFKTLRKQLRLAQDRLQFDYPKSRKLLMQSEEEIQAVYGWVELHIDHGVA